LGKEGKEGERKGRKGIGGGEGERGGKWKGRDPAKFREKLTPLLYCTDAVT